MASQAGTAAARALGFIRGAFTFGEFIDSTGLTRDAIPMPPEYKEIAGRFDIPDDRLVKTSRDGDGIMFVDPEIDERNVRIMSGNPDSPLPAQQKPYVVDTRNNLAVDANGRLVNPRLPEAHVPLDQYEFITDIKKRAAVSYTPSKGYISFILESISTFASITFQRRIWVEGKGPEVSSYNEALSFVLDEGALFKILAGAWKNAGWSQEQRDAVAYFVELLDRFHDENSPFKRDLDVIEHPEWPEVVAAAQAVITLFPPDKWRYEPSA